MRRTFALPKSNKLKSIVAITQLFDEGKSDFMYPIKMVYLIKPRGEKFETFKCSVSVPKKIFKKATDRNILRRRIRNSIRLNQQILYAYCTQALVTIEFMAIFVGKDISSYQQIDKSVRSLFEKMIKDV